MTLDITKFNTVVEMAKTRTSDRRWLSAIDKAVAGVTSGWWVITELADCVAITTESGQTYFANGSCQCKAYELGQPCKHRALARLLDLYHEEEKSSVTTKATEGPSRESLISSIKSTWGTKFPGESLADELLARFRVNYLEALSLDFLMVIKAVIA